MSTSAEHGPIARTTAIDSNVKSGHEDHAVIERADLLRIAFVIVVAAVVWFAPQLSGWVLPGCSLADSPYSPKRSRTCVSGG